MTPRSSVVVLSVIIALGVVPAAQVNGRQNKGGEDLTGPYDVVRGLVQAVAIGRFVKYDVHGKLITYWGTQGAFPGAFNNNHSFSVDPEGNLYVADYQNYRVQKFTPKPNADRTRLIGPRFVAGAVRSGK